VKVELEIKHVVLVVIAIGAWITFVEHPTARNLRVAVLDTLSL